MDSIQYLGEYTILGIQDSPDKTLDMKKIATYIIYKYVYGQ